MAKIAGEAEARHIEEMAKIAGEAEARHIEEMAKIAGNKAIFCIHFVCVC